jgi:hypothetical protein
MNRVQRHRRWATIEWLLVAMLVLLVLWSVSQHVPF